MTDARYEVQQRLGGWRVMDRWTGVLRSRTYSNENAARLAAARLNRGVFTPQEANMNEGYGPLTHYTATFYIFKRGTGTGFEPTGISVPSALSEEGARAALQHCFKRQGREGRDQYGMWLVQSPQGAWTFEVSPPEPAPNVIRTR